MTWGVNCERGWFQDLHGKKQKGTKHPSIFRASGDQQGQPFLSLPGFITKIQLCPVQRVMFQSTYLGKREHSLNQIGFEKKVER